MTNARSTNKGINTEAFEYDVHWAVFTVPIAAATSRYIYVYAPDGKMCKLTSFKAYAIFVEGATLGEHGFTLDDNVTAHYFKGRSVFGTIVHYDYFHWIVADVIQLPSDPTAQALVVKNVLFSNTKPLRLIYTNATNAIVSVAPFILLNYQVVRKSQN